MDVTKKQLLLIDDDIELCKLLKCFLEIEGYQLDFVHNGFDGIKTLEKYKYKLVLLDVGLPDIDGFDTLLKIRKFSNVMILMLTARGDYQDRIKGLESGADDYLPKPYNHQELLARIKALLRREQPIISEATINIDDFTLHSKTKIAYKSDNNLNLTATEFTILRTLLENPNILISKEELTELVLNRPFTLFDRAIDMHVSNVRKKIGLRINGDPYIKTVRGLGYQYNAHDFQQN